MDTETPYDRVRTIGNRGFGITVAANLVECASLATLYALPGKYPNFVQNHPEVHDIAVGGAWTGVGLTVLGVAVAAVGAVRARRL